MEFDINRVYTSVNADELKVGSKVIVADNLNDLKERVKECDEIKIIGAILSDEYDNRFNCNYEDYNLCYLIEEPEKKKLKWTDLKIGDVIRYGVFTHLVTGIHNFEQTNKHIFVSGAWLTDDELEEWEKVEE